MTLVYDSTLMMASAAVKYFVTDAWLRATSDSILDKDTLKVGRITQTASV